MNELPRIIGAIFDSYSSQKEPEVILGQIPISEFPGVALPANSSAIASMVLDSLTYILFESSLSPDGVIEFYEQYLRNLNWRRENFKSMFKGFLPAELVNKARFFYAEEGRPFGVSLEVKTKSLSENRTEVLLQLLEVARVPDFLDDQPYQNVVESPFPVLIHPPSAREVGVVNYDITETGEMISGRIIEINLTLSSLIHHYAEQLQQSG